MPQKIGQNRPAGHGPSLAAVLAMAAALAAAAFLGGALGLVWERLAGGNAPPEVLTGAPSASAGPATQA